MEFFAGLDVSVRTTRVCVMAPEGKVVRGGKVETDPGALAAFLSEHGARYGRVGLEAGPLCQWLYAGLAKAGFPVFCIGTRRAQAVLSVQINKTDRNDARGIAQMMRVGLFKPVHVKTLASQEVRALLGGRRFLQTSMIDIENSIRGLLRNFGLKVGLVTRSSYEACIRELIEGETNLEAVISPMLAVRRTIREQYAALHRRMLLLAKKDGVCRLLMTAPGIGPFVAL
jgi:transposase